jgi:hypothetical protein
VALELQLVSLPAEVLRAETLHLLVQVLLLQPLVAVAVRLTMTAVLTLLVV